MSKDDLYLNPTKALALDILCFFDEFTDEEQLAKLKARLQQLEDKGKGDDWKANYFYEELLKEKKVDPLSISDHICGSLTEKQITDLWTTTAKDEVFQLHVKMHEAYIKASLGPQKSVIGEKRVSNETDSNGNTSNTPKTNGSEGTSTEPSGNKPASNEASTSSTPITSVKLNHDFRSIDVSFLTKKKEDPSEMPYELTRLTYFDDPVPKKPPRLQINTAKNDLILKHKLSLCIPSVAISTHAHNENTELTTQPETEERPKNLVNIKTTNSDDIETYTDDENKEYAQFEHGIQVENRDVSNRYVTPVPTEHYREAKYIHGSLYLATEEPVYYGTTSGLVNTLTPTADTSPQTPVYSKIYKREAAYLHAPQLYIDVPMYYLGTSQQLTNVPLGGSYQQNSTGFAYTAELSQLVTNKPSNVNKNQSRSNTTMHYGPHQHASRFTMHPLTLLPNRVPPGFENYVPSCNVVDIKAGGDNAQNVMHLELEKSQEKN